MACGELWGPWLGQRDGEVAASIPLVLPGVKLCWCVGLAGCGAGCGAVLTPLPPLSADDVSPYFKTEPVRSQVHLEGNRLVLTCMAEGSWPLEFKWLHNNRELTKFSLEYR